MAFQNIIVEEQDGIAILQFNRPNALNALNLELLGELGQALDEMMASKTIRVLILTGGGDKAFVAGADISEIASLNPLQAKAFSAKGHEVLSKLSDLPFPVIAAVNGYALGGGSEVTLACDFAYASDKAVFGLPEITLGIIPGFGGTQTLARLIGTSRAKELIFTGQNITADKALEYGMVNKVVPHDQLMEEVKKTAKIIASRGKASLHLAKQTVQQGMQTDLKTGYLLEEEGFALTVTNEDAREGTSAFLEKRKANFTGELQ